MKTCQNFRKCGRNAKSSRAKFCLSCFQENAAIKARSGSGNSQGNPGNAGNSKGNPDNAGNSQGNPANAGNSQGNPGNAGNSQGRGNAGIARQLWQYHSWAQERNEEVCREAMLAGLNLRS